MNYLEYIKQNSERIQNEKSYPFTIEGIYNGRIEKLKAIKNSDFQQCLSKLFNEQLSRGFVKNCFSTSSYFGFVAAMLWGGLGFPTYITLVSLHEKSTLHQPLDCLFTR